MSESDLHSAWVPAWVAGIDMAIWIVGPDGNICFINEHAQELLGSSAADCLGLPCHRVVGGTDASGHPFCRSDCPVFRQARANARVAPMRLRIQPCDDESRWIQVVIIPVKAPGRSGSQLIHCAIDVDRACRIEEYLTRVASRTLSAESGLRPPDAASLTPRETEILILLSQDEDAHSIAASLHVSHATVRNHIQHLVAKMRAHSITEAVARYLLFVDGPRDHLN